MIWEKRQGRGIPNRLYLLKPAIPNKLDKIFKSEKIFQSRVKEFYPLEGKDFSSNNTYNNNTDYINQSIKSKDREIEEIIVEIEKTQAIPYSYHNSYNKMKIAIDYFANAKDYLYAYKESELEGSIYELVVSCLVEMSCDFGKNVCSGSYITYEMIIDNINKCIDSKYGLGHFIDSIIEDFSKQSKNEEIKNTKKYMKTCLWNGFSTYQVKWNSFFERSYYKSISK